MAYRKWFQCKFLVAINSKSVRKREEFSTTRQTRNSWRNETAMHNWQVWQMTAKSWSLVPFAFHVNAMLNLSSSRPDVHPVFFYPLLRMCLFRRAMLSITIIFNHFLQHAERQILHFPWQSKQETHKSKVPVATRCHMQWGHHNEQITFLWMNLPG